MATDQPADYEFDAALSFAGEDRAYVQDVATALKAVTLKVFYDADYLAETWGEDLGEFFDGVYRLRSRFAILFVSQHYVDKMWTRHERRSALARALEEKSAYVLPVRLDDTEVPGLRPTVGYLDARRVGIDGLVTALIKKLAAARQGVKPGTVDRVPRTDAEMAVVRREQPPGWEWLYFGGALHINMAKLTEQYLDHEMGFAEGTGERVTHATFVEWIQARSGEAAHLAQTLEQVLSPEAQQRAFGLPGEAGDPDRILHLARRSTSIYEGFLKWTARVLGASAPDEARPVIKALARFADGPIEQYRTYVQEAVRQLDEVPALVASGGQHVISLPVTFSVAEGTVSTFNEQLDRYSEHLFSQLEE